MYKGKINSNVMQLNVSINVSDYANLRKPTLSSITYIISPHSDIIMLRNKLIHVSKVHASVS